MLLDDFFTYSLISKNEDQICAEIKLNSQHHIFKGHFPESPIVPGVCQVQMIQEVLNDSLKEAFQLSHAQNIKFLSFINPEVDPLLTLDIKLIKKEDRSLKIKALLSQDSKKCLKISALFGKE